MIVGAKLPFFWRTPALEMEPSERLLDQIPQLVSYATVIKAIWTASRLTEHVRKQDGYGRVIKPDSSPVTVADLAAQMTVLDGIQSAFLGESVIAEEDSTSLTDEDIIAEVTRILDLFGVEVQMESLIYVLSV